MTEHTVNLEATIFARMNTEAGTIETGVLNAPEGRAMFVFRSEAEAERYRAETRATTRRPGGGGPSPLRRSACEESWRYTKSSA